ncbi:MAG: FtsX-like permease family protein, partial [Clostridia bacterium]|nr:FtsX-like permease family protein [Clostridia bacterium]
AFMISAVAGISVIVGGIGMMSSMISNVENRKTEIGIYMALGMTEKDILRMHLVESVIITAAGGILGVALSAGIIHLIKTSGILDITANVTAIMICFGFAVVSGCIFGYIPAKKASDMNPINAIRWE